MQADNIHNSGRIAKNTLVLYIRMIFLMVIGLYASRVVLSALGENDFGVYNVVGGVVAMFSIISGALNSAVQRFITFELGKGRGAMLGKVYSAAVIVQIALAVIVVACAEPIGLWFIDNKMTIDPSRISTARMVLHFSLLSFVINLMSIPQMALITAHERMSAYAWIGILDGILRLSAAIAISVSSADRLLLYAGLMAGAVVVVRVVYWIYCKAIFTECRFQINFNPALFKEMFSFAGWNFIGVASGVLRDHGGNILVNLFSGPAVNAARGVAVQLNGAVQGFVTNFMTAVNPQITKSYASGDCDYTFSLVKKSSRLSFYLLLFIALPVIFNADYLLEIWLADVPAHAPLFVRLFLVFALSESLSNPMITAMLATGNIRKYQIVVGGLQLLNLPVSYVLLRMGCIPEVTVIVAIVISQVCMFARLKMFSSATGFSVSGFMREVYFPAVFKVALVSILLPYSMTFIPVEGVWRFLMLVSACLLSVSFVVYFWGITSDEKAWMLGMIKKRFAR